jgi:hypothetical protein
VLVESGGEGIGPTEINLTEVNIMALSNIAGWNENYGRGVHAAHPTNRQHVVHLRSPQLVVQEISPLKHLQHVGWQISRKRNLQLAEVLVVQGTNKKDIPC